MIAIWSMGGGLLLLILAIWWHRRRRALSVDLRQSPFSVLVDCGCLHFSDAYCSASYYRFQTSNRSVFQSLQLALAILHQESGEVHVIVPLPRAILVSTEFAEWLNASLRRCPRPLLNRLVLEIQGDDPTLRIVIRQLRNMGCRVIRLLNAHSQVALTQCHVWDGFILDASCIADIEEQVAQQMRFRALLRAQLPNIHALIFVRGVCSARQWAWLISQGKVGGEGPFFSPEHRTFSVSSHTLSSLFTR